MSFQSSVPPKDCHETQRETIKRDCSPTLDDRAQAIVQAITNAQLSDRERRDIVYQILTEAQPDEPTA